MLNQRETGLRAVDLTKVSKSISAFIRLQFLSQPLGFRSALKRYVKGLNSLLVLEQLSLMSTYASSQNSVHANMPPHVSNDDQLKSNMNENQRSWTELLYDSHAMSFALIHRPFSMTTSSQVRRAFRSQILPWTDFIMTPSLQVKNLLWFRLIIMGLAMT